MANINVNRVNITISNADDTAIVAAITDMNTVLDPYLTALTQEERESLFALGEENLAFATLAFQQAQALGTLIPPALSSLVANLENDLIFHEQLLQIENVFVAQIAQKVGDTRRLAGHEAYVGGLTVYKIIEALASIGVTGAEAAYDILKVRFANQGGGAPLAPSL